MNKQRNRSKSSRRKGWPYDNIGGTNAEKNKDRADRIAATKKNSRKKRARAKYATPKETPELKAAEAVRAKEAARKLFERFLEGPRVTKFLAKGQHRRYGLTWWVKGWLDELGKEMNGEVT